MACSGKCGYYKRCEKFKDQLNIPGPFFDPQHDTCDCLGCHTERGDDLYYPRGQPATRYALPVEWCRFAIRVPQGKAEGLNVGSKWHRAYHGTSSGAIKGILETGELVRPGNYPMQGDMIGERDGHIKDNPHFDSHRIFVSPSIKYAGHSCYATPERTTIDKIEYNVRYVLQVFIKPGSYTVGRETLAPGDKVSDPLFSDTELEWSTVRQGCTIIYGLLISLEAIDTEGLLEVARQHTIENNYEQAEQHAMQLWQQKPKDADVMSLLSAIHVDCDRLDKGKYFGQKAIEQSPRHGPAHGCLALAYKKSGQIQEALTHYKKAVEINPEHAITHNNMGSLLDDQGKLEEALKHYKEAIRIDPNYADAHNNMGVTLRQMGDHHGALQCYTKAIQINPDHASAHNNMGDLLCEQGKLDEALKHYKEAIRINPNYADAHFDMGSTLDDMGDHHGALQCYTKAIQINPDHATAHNNMGAAHELMGNVSEAMACYMTALRLEPENSAASNNLARVKAKKS